MALKVKAVEKKVKFSKNDPGVWRYVMSPDLYIALSQEKVIKAWATEGLSVALPGLGSMRFGLRAKSVEDVNDVKTSLIKTRRIIFTPAVDLKDELKNTAIQITCIDRNGNEVKRVTSADAGTIEDPEANENENGSENGSEQNGGSQAESVDAPTISGETPFDNTTQVTLSGPDGAEIRYTVDGSTPTAESSLYSEALTLTDTVLVKAIAIKNGVSSEVASKTFTKNGSNGGGGFDTGS